MLPETITTLALAKKLGSFAGKGSQALEHRYSDAAEIERIARNAAGEPRAAKLRPRYRRA